ncbi:carbohydrate kinase family protein [Ferroglobus sp.]|uniref:carbohydrate kinase family protein n=1 Tax=Ferroglobus sp. TaxID=2614230 RepID=UPI0025BD9E9C|nr:carbohydrate kinase family protein [Ferroglobus sp.]
MIAGFGPALVDIINVIDKYPERGGHAIVKESFKLPGGAAANVIFGLASFGVKAKFFSPIGKDEEAKIFKESMERVGVILKLWEVNGKTGVVEVFVDSSGERTFFVHPNASTHLDVEIDDEEFFDLDYVYLDPYPSEKSLDFHTKVAKKAKKFKIEVILNPGYPYASMGLKKLKELLKYVDTLILSESELKLLGERVFDYCPTVVVTLGKRGAEAYSNGVWFFEKAFEVTPVDTTGAGDAFASGFIYGRILGLDIKKCLKLGNFVASYNIQHYGARSFPPKRIVDEFIRAIS